jgi:hypothetical protein
MTTICTARAYAAGHCDAGAEVPEALEEVVAPILRGCVRLTPWIDKQALATRLMARGIGPDDAKAIAESAHIRFDDAYFASRSG